jgi:hypothetical protein
LTTAFLVETVFAAGGGTVRDAAPAEPASSSSTTVHLQQQDVDYAVARWNVSVTTQSSRFKAEPPLARGKIVRGILQFGHNSRDSIPFIWHRTDGKLFLDLNRNRDLTDDPGGVFSASPPVLSSYQTFTNVYLSFNTPSGTRQIRMDLSLWATGSGAACMAAVRSFWQGEAMLKDQEWQVGIVENTDNGLETLDGGSMLMRPWSERAKPFNSDSQDTFQFSRHLFVGNHAYELDWTNGPPAPGAGLDLRFTEQQPGLGEMKISGTYVQRIVLKGDPYVVVMDDPPATVKVPVGNYADARIWLKAGDVQAYHDSDRTSPGKQITIGEQQPATLTAGGPLTNSVLLKRRGSHLSLNYQLVGAGGTVYQLLGQDRSKPPRFAIYRGDKRIASGKFEFG